ncbi:DNA repair exonuclease SbcCD ATPase subunit [Paenibacillus sp. UNCCL117]|uniref:AAA family ATPase n=1 Tax=unclassified Paenibacillus TaxID=185978 RepID=UPI0008833FEB|nr:MULTISPECIES: SMC family ATPase [unclassified Paenibacillus]SDE06977.1 DNA repair exonuclease SbcCD ATPase subunit [Paenibacillus sp. cl123]SFW59266.1 DNA repair exonuclease SbcCD ATPase subunit [Paenibacillus sp. UNCCL117]
MREVIISRMSIDHFRGYRNKQIFDLTKGSNFTVLSGSNGYGKTSFFDAIEWVFTGKLFRYEEPNEEKSKSHFINYQPFEKPAEVKVELQTRSATFILTRQAVNFDGASDYGPNKSFLSLTSSDGKRYYEQEAVDKLNDLLISEEWRDKLDFPSVFTQFHLLTQDKLKHFIQGLKGPARYNQISNLLGTSRFKEYGLTYKQIKNDISQKMEKIEKVISDTTTKINFLNNRINTDQLTNFDGHSKFELFLQSSIENYNYNINQVNLDKINWNINANDVSTLNELSKQISSRVLTSINDLNIRKNKISNEIRNAEEVYSNKDLFYLNQKKVEILEILIPLQIEERNLESIIRNWNSYADYSNQETEINTRISTYTSQIEQYSSDIDKLKGISNLISEFMASPLKVNNINFQNSIQKIESSLIKLQNSIGIYNISPKIINFHDLLLSLQNNNIEESIEKFTSEIESINKQKQEVSNELSNIKLLINSMLDTEEDYKNVLNLTRDYILKQHLHNDKTETDCPVCNSTFQKDLLLNILNEKISSNNPQIIENIKIQENLEQKVKVIEDKFTKLINSFNEQLINYNEFYREKYTITSELVNKFEKELFSLRNQKDELRNKLKNLQEQQDEIRKIIDLLRLPDNSNELLQYVNQRLKEIKNITNSYKDLDIEVSQETLDKCKILINNLEQKLSNSGFGNFDPELKMYIARQTEEVKLLVDVISNLELLSDKFTKQQETLNNNKDYLELQNLKQTLNEHNSKYQEEKKILIQVDNIMDAVDKLVEEMNNQILHDNEELINNIYKRIYPHPFFTNIKLELTTNNQGNNTLQIKCFKDDNSQLEVNPTFTFSTAQMNVVAISIFLALALRQQCTNLRTILLDDPIQSMDDINILSFIDILRSMSSDHSFSGSFNKQMILSTHDEKIYRLLNKKLRFLNTQQLRYIDYNSSGPVISY